MVSEEESFGQTLESGLKRLDELIARAREQGDEGIAGEDAFLLHDTYGFPIDMTLEIVTEQGLGVDEAGFESLMGEQRTRARRGSRGSRATSRSASGLPRCQARRALRPSSSAMRRPTRRPRSARSAATATASC